MQKIPKKNFTGVCSDVCFEMIKYNINLFLSFFYSLYFCFWGVFFFLNDKWNEFYGLHNIYKEIFSGENPLLIDWQMRMCSTDLHYILTLNKNRLSANRNPRNSLTMASQRKYPLSDLRKMATFYLAFTQAFINVGIVLRVNAIAWRAWFISVYRPTL